MPVTKEDIEAKALELVEAVEDTTESVKDRAVLGVLVVAAVVAVAFIIGRRRGRRKKTVVEVYRV